MWIATILICQSSFLFGFALSSLNACLVLGDKNKAAACFNGDDDASPNCPPGTIYNDMLLSPFEASLATSLTVIGAWIGCLSGSHPSEKYGRKKTLLYNNILFIGGALVAASGNDIMLYMGRFLIGLAVGITSTVAPCLIAEISSDSHRGTLTTMFQLILTIGILTASLLAYGLVTNVNHGWQYVQACGAIPALVQLIFQSWIPESPKWILSKLNDRQAAMDVLSDLRSEDDNVEVEIQQMQIAAENDESPKSDGESTDVTWAGESCSNIV